MKKNKFNKGFTLLETVVALGVLAIGITGLFVMLQDIETNFSYAKGYITAAYLNQEAIEFFRNIKDSNVYKPSPTEETYDSGILDGYWELDVNATTEEQLSPVSGIENCFSNSFNVKNCYDSSLKEFKKRSSFPYYFYGAETDQHGFMKRAIMISKVIDNDNYGAIKVESRVFFKVKNNYYMHKVIHYMYDR